MAMLNNQRVHIVGQGHFHPNVANLQILVGFHVVNAHGFWNRPFPNKKHISGYTTHPWHKNHISLYSVYWAFPFGSFFINMFGKLYDTVCD
jgi:hypothetical protein